MTPLPYGLYGIADTAFGDPVHSARALADGGARVIQLRAKGASTAERVTALKRMRAVVCASIPLVVNDDLEAALAAHADGLHLGQDDGDPRQARARLGPTALLGWSTHSLAQVEDAQQLGVLDYIGFGPVFRTATKRGAGRALGVDLLRQAVDQSALPIVAIGGIHRGVIDGVVATGVQSWAVISAILGDADPAAAAQVFSRRSRSEAS